MESDGRPGLIWYTPNKGKWFQIQGRIWYAGLFDDQPWFVVDDSNQYTDEEMRQEMRRGMADKHNAKVRRKRHQSIRRIRESIRKLDTEGDS